MIDPIGEHRDARRPVSRDVLTQLILGEADAQQPLPGKIGIFAIEVVYRVGYGTDSWQFSRIHNVLSALAQRASSGKV